jgi:D-alanyl-lipoteichoic acid acyltransferase DltB (MBOAT superfamily)
LAVALNLLLLGYYKYANFFLETVSAALPIIVPALNIALPIGISFLTFTEIAFLVDTFRGQAREHKLHHYVLFVTFFPHLIAGPILHHKEMMPQFQDRQTYKLHPSLFTLGLSWFAAGLFKKVILADTIGAYVAPVFDSLSPSLGLADAWMAVISFALQLYFDFSRLLRYGHRFGAPLRNTIAAQFQFPLPSNLNYGFLAALAHDAVALFARLPVLSSRG